MNEVAVHGVPDEKWGEVGKVFYSVKSGYQILNEDIRAHCLQHLAKFKVPKYFHPLDELPKNDSGKIDRKRLKTLKA